MSTPYEAVDAALLALMQTLPGLAVYDSEPVSLGPLPAAYPIFGRYESRAPGGGVSTMTTITVWRLVVQQTEKAASQRVLRPYVNTVHALVEANRGLGGLGTAWVAEGVHKLVTLGTKKYAALDHAIHVEQIYPTGAGL